MAKQKTTYVCAQCSYQTAKWLGQCPECGSWESLNEQHKTSKKRANLEKLPETLAFQAITTTTGQRISCGIAEFDRVMGGGLMQGSMVLLGGEPGIGKSTILLQVANALARKYQVLYVSAEESAAQLKMRGNRLQLDQAFQVLVETRFEIIEEILLKRLPDVVIIDSVQTIGMMDVDNVVGSLSQIKEVTARLLQLCKPRNMTVVLVGHITKDGSIAGPKSLEHMVDGVFYFEGDTHMDLRLIRAQKNRFGPTGEMGIWRMTGKGLEEVENPSTVLLAHRPDNAPGSVVVPCIEGSRPLLIEIQVLTSQSAYGTSRRLTNGIDSNRLAMLMAVMEKHLGIHSAGLDVFANVVGGLNVREPALDLGIIMALVSSIRGQSLPTGLVCFGEVGLVGEVRAVRQADVRIKECRRLGFKHMLCPQDDKLEGKDIQNVSTVADAAEWCWR